MSLTGGTETWERAQAAWDLGETLPEFDARPDEEQDWAVATWRTMRKIDRIRVVESGD